MADVLDVDALLTATEAAAYAKVSVQAIVNWRNRGHLKVAAWDDTTGLPLYRLLDVAKAEHATAKRARRT